MDYTINILKFRYELLYKNLHQSYKFIYGKESNYTCHPNLEILVVHKCKLPVQHQITFKKWHGIEKGFKIFKIMEENGKLACFVEKAKKMEIEHTAK